MYTLSAAVLRTNYMMEVMRYNAIEETWKQFEEADRKYYKTCEGGDRVTKLIHDLESYGVDYKDIIDRDLEIRDEVESEAA